MTVPLPIAPAQADSPLLEQARAWFVGQGLEEELLESGQVRLSSLLYLAYWAHRLRANPEEQARLGSLIVGYLAGSRFDPALLDGGGEEGLVTLARAYVKTELRPVGTVDLVIERSVTVEGREDKAVLLFERPHFPHGWSLPGGLVQDSDEANPWGLDARTFAALRVAAEKVLGVDLATGEGKIHVLADAEGRPFCSVESTDGVRKLILHPVDLHGYFVKENLQAVLRPSDPRHLVDTVGFKCELVAGAEAVGADYLWETKSNLLKGTDQALSARFAFAHHKEIIFHMLARTSVEAEMAFQEADFVRTIMADPQGQHQRFMARFQANGLRSDTSFPELFPTVNHMLQALFTPEVNTLCAEQPSFIGFRDKVANRLRHVALKNRTFCPYLPTVTALFDAVAFWDVVARHQKAFYQTVPSDRVIEHNPKETEHAAYHMYKYRYRMDELLAQVPNELILPTFASLSATDLMRVRGVPLRFVGLSTAFVYVDEFEQSPEEFLMHDVNHSYRMMEEDTTHRSAQGISPAELLAQQAAFIPAYLAHIKPMVGDSEKTREIKKIKKIIIFEVVHEEAKPFLPDVILASIVKKEGGETRFEMPVIDPKTGYLDIVDVVDTEINTLSYVRNKLQCGFYDRVDKQNVHIVNPAYRKSAFIAEAAFAMVAELSALLGRPVEVDEAYLLKRTCSVGPDNIHTSQVDDKDLAVLAEDGAHLNPKRYRSNQVLSGA